MGSRSFDSVNVKHDIARFGIDGNCNFSVLRICISTHILSNAMVYVVYVTVNLREYSDVTACHNFKRPRLFVCTAVVVRNYCARSRCTLSLGNVYLGFKGNRAVRSNIFAHLIKLGTCKGLAVCRFIILIDSVIMI